MITLAEMIKREIVIMIITPFLIDEFCFLAIHTFIPQSIAIDTFGEFRLIFPCQTGAAPKLIHSRLFLPHNPPADQNRNE